MNNLFLTGKVGVGKSTILQNALNQIDMSIGGYNTKRVIEGDYMKFLVRTIRKWTYSNIRQKLKI